MSLPLLPPTATNGVARCADPHDGRRRRERGGGRQRRRPGGRRRRGRGERGDGGDRARGGGARRGGARRRASTAWSGRSATRRLPPRPPTAWVGAPDWPSWRGSTCRQGSPSPPRVRRRWPQVAPVARGRLRGRIHSGIPTNLPAAATPKMCIDRPEIRYRRRFSPGSGRAAERANAPRSNRPASSAASTTSPGSAMPIDAASAERTRSTVTPRAARSPSVIAPSRLARRCPDPPDDERNVRVARRRLPERAQDRDLGRGRWAGDRRRAPRGPRPGPCRRRPPPGCTPARRRCGAGRRRSRRSAIRPATTSSNVDGLVRRTGSGSPEPARGDGGPAPPTTDRGTCRGRPALRCRVARQPRRGSPAASRSTRTSARARRAARARRRTPRSGHVAARPVRPSPGRAPPDRPAAPVRAPSDDATRSRSSVRSTNRSPVERAASQAIIAVRRLPRCRGPVGEGANRPVIADSVRRSEA